MELIILIGLQAAGKSIFYEAYFQPSGDYVYISKDRLRNNPHPERRQRELLVEALAAGRSVVVDNKIPSEGERAPLIAHGKEHGATISGYFFEPAVGASLARNRQRAGKPRGQGARAGRCDFRDTQTPHAANFRRRVRSALRSEHP